MDEQWRPVRGWENVYLVSDMGRVMSLAREVHQVRYGRPFLRRLPDRILRGNLNTSGHRQVSLTPLSGPPLVLRLVHHLVLEAFVGPCPAGLEGCHNNGVSDDNRLINLRWDTRSANQLDAVRHGVHASTAKTHCPRFHPYDEVNTVWRINTKGRSTRCCRECERRKVREYRARLKLRRGDAA